MSKRIGSPKGNFGYYNFYEDMGIFMPTAPEVTREKITPGVYTVGRTMDGRLYLSSMMSTTDTLVKLPNFTSEQIINEVKSFWNDKTKAHFERYGLVYKRGILLHGNPGTGKTCTIASVMDNVVNEGGIVVFNPDPALLANIVNAVRQIEPDLKVLTVFEEFDNLVDNPEFLSLMDGQLQLENIVYIATTNYIHNIPLRIRNRPSRFATVLEVGPPAADVRQAYLAAKLRGEDAKLIEELVARTDGMVIDQIKDVIVSICCIGLEMAEAIEKIRLMGYEEEAPESNGDGVDAAIDLANKLIEARERKTSRSYSSDRPAGSVL